MVAPVAVYATSEGGQLGGNGGQEGGLLRGVAGEEGGLVRSVAGMLGRARLPQAPHCNIGGGIEVNKRFSKPASPSPPMLKPAVPSWASLRTITLKLYKYLLIFTDVCVEILFPLPGPPPPATQHSKHGQNTS